MFGKKTDPSPMPPTTESHEMPFPIIGKTETKANTVISSDTTFEGNIVTTGMVSIHGILHGNVDAEDGIISVLQGGEIHGDVNCKNLNIDGQIIGQCQAESIEIYANGNITGSIIYEKLSVKKGGALNGHAQHMAQDTHRENVITFHAEMTSEPKFENEEFSI
ncbi:bactofilin family protein [Citrobacter amalonaticus]|nr:polymer-forming cytoskeletal protein [Citrobacter amalonaticus]